MSARELFSPIITRKRNFIPFNFFILFFFFPFQNNSNVSVNVGVILNIILATTMQQHTSLSVSTAALSSHQDIPFCFECKLSDGLFCTVCTAVFKCTCVGIYSLLLFAASLSLLPRPLFDPLVRLPTNWISNLFNYTLFPSKLFNLSGEYSSQVLYFFISDRVYPLVSYHSYPFILKHHYFAILSVLF